MGGWVVEVRNEGGHWVLWAAADGNAVFPTEAAAKEAAEENIGGQREWRTRDLSK